MKWAAALTITLVLLTPCRGGGIEDVPPVIIDYFYEPGCPDCVRVEKQVMPSLQERFKGFYVLTSFDVGIRSNVVTLVQYQEHLNITKNEPVCMVVDYEHVLNGFDAIKNGLLERIDESIGERQEPGWRAPQPIAAPDLTNGQDLARRRMATFTLGATMMAGLIDGINPCAIGTLVFFMSLLSVSKVRGRGLLLVGIPFCAASFVTYTAIGFGMLRALHLLDGFERARTVVEILMIGLLGLFALLSFKDAYRFKMSGKTSDVTLQLPHRMKLRIRAIMRSGLRSRNLLIGGLVIGTLVTALESVCTGQVYVPALVIIIKDNVTSGRAWNYLLFYNLMFITPLAIVFILTYAGLNTQTLMEWSKKNVVISKALLGLFFVAMGVLICLL